MKLMQPPRSRLLNVCHVLVLVVECWTSEVSTWPEKGAQKDNHSLRKRRRTLEKGGERLEAQPEAGQPRR